MEKRGQVQTNVDKINVLVDTTKSDNDNHSHLNKRVEVIKVLSDEEIIDLWRKNVIVDKLALAKKWIMKEEGYAYSNCCDKTLDITNGSIVEYKSI